VLYCHSVTFVCAAYLRCPVELSSVVTQIDKAALRTGVPWFQDMTEYSSLRKRDENLSDGLLYFRFDATRYTSRVYGHIRGFCLDLVLL
jgi:hypothetical protein